MVTVPSDRDVRRSAGGVLGRWLVAAVAALLLAGCGGPKSVSLADLAFEMEEHDGREVIATGVVVEFDEDDGALERHFVIQDSEANRVQLLPEEAAEPHVGSTVEVVGEFEFDPNRGRLLHVESIRAVGSGS